MGMEIKKVFLDYEIDGISDRVGAFVFVPEQYKGCVGLFTHGYTSHKGSILNWSLRLAEGGMAGVLFDLPGHYLGTFSKVSSFDGFKKVTPVLFENALNRLKESLSVQINDSTKMVLGGHSLGALMALKASALPVFKSYKDLLITVVGFGMPPEGMTHLFDTPFYKSTLKIREQLVEESISPNVIFPWIKEEKENLTLKNKKIYFLTGDDDVVVGKDGVERLAKKLEAQGNSVFIEKPNRLPHHNPELAAPHLKKFFKDQGYFS